jgi:hypothetical protein
VVVGAGPLALAASFRVTASADHDHNHRHHHGDHHGDHHDNAITAITMVGTMMIGVIAVRIGAAVHVARCRKMRTLVLGAIFLSSFSASAFADWWIVRSSDKQCFVVDIEPTGKGVTKIGKASYKSEEDATADAKALCK